MSYKEIFHIEVNLEIIFLMERVKYIEKIKVELYQPNMFKASGHRR